MKVKTCAAQIKAAGTHEGTADGVFDALVATYDLDSVGDKITPGAFAETLALWQKSGDPIPVYWSHRMDDPNMNIGSVIEAKETEQGLQVKAQLDLDNPTAAQVYRLLKGRRVTQFSFAYDVDDGSFVEPKDAAPFYELRKLSLYEVGPTPIGANQATELIDVKTAQRNVTVEVRNANQDETGAIARAVKRALRHPRKAPLAPPEAPEAAGDVDPDDDPAALISAADASLDEAAELLAGVDVSALPSDVQQAIALVNGAEALIDTVMELLGIPDPDDEADSGPKQHTDVRSKEGRRNAASDMKTLQDIHDATLQLGADCSASASDDSGADDTGKSQQGAMQATPTTTATTEEPDGAKADEPAWDGAASIRLRTQLELMQVELS